MPRIDDPYLECVIYLYRTLAEARDGEPHGGSGFLVGVERRKEPKTVFVFAVANRHVVAEYPVIRLNKVGTGVEIIELDAPEWIDHPDGDDLSVYPISLDAEQINYHCVPEWDFIDQAIIAAHNIGPGDDVFMVGRFINHEGRQRNAPSVRFGNISMMPIEPMWHCEYHRDQESFAVEMRSLGGYSGSPVFVYCEMGTLRPTERGPLPNSYFIGPYLLGIDWCHIPNKLDLRNKFGEPMGTGQHVVSNSGMAGVIPAWKLKDMLHMPKCRAIIEEQERQLRERRGQGVDVVLDRAGAPSTTADNPSHKEDFNRLVDAAVKGRKSDDQTSR